ncbi:MAG TPA: hypothetical protein VGR70_06875 [Stellaceae bacterium]|nr:hypothetical protein [Stellaceae bacterium]
MRQRIAFAVLLGAVLVSTGAFAACPAPATHPKPHQKAQKPLNGCVDLNSLPQISANIVAIEPLPARKPATPFDLGDRPYTGPSLGLTKPEPGVKPTPTFGYHWSLD